MKILITTTVNGDVYEVAVEPQRTLLELLRNELELTGTKEGCGTGDCGACTVIMDGRPVNGCLVLSVEADGKSIITIEGLATENSLHPIQEAFITYGGVQCGFCTPGMIISAKVLLDKNPHPTEEEIKIGISGNLCRCTGYTKIIEAIKAVAEGKIGTAVSS
ncbi:MAG: (2Fe-2S)-binding protein [Candidatus Tectomicrobia bacterium]|nr:(2Fe-2S)-binding protein [Candidatus Tectomicrobia bacterium]